MLTKRAKSGVIKKFQKHDADTGSAEVQIGVLSRRITEITKHLGEFTKDQHARSGLLKLVGRRRRLLAYLKRTDSKTYEKVAEQVGLKK